jgi:hypothetical protein
VVIVVSPGTLAILVSQAFQDTPDLVFLGGVATQGTAGSRVFRGIRDIAVSPDSQATLESPVILVREFLVIQVRVSQDTPVILA